MEILRFFTILLSSEIQRGSYFARLGVRGRIALRKHEIDRPSETATGRRVARELIEHIIDALHPQCPSRMYIMCRAAVRLHTVQPGKLAAGNSLLNRLPAHLAPIDTAVDLSINEPLVTNFVVQCEKGRFIEPPFFYTS